MPVSLHRRGALSAGEDNGGDQRAESQANGEFVVGTEHVGRKQADKKTAHCATERDDHIETGKVARVGLEAHQLAVTHHAADEERKDKQADGEAQVGFDIAGPEAVRHVTERGDE